MNSKVKIFSAIGLVLIAVCALFFFVKSPKADKQSASKSVAKVNGTSISSHELDALTARGLDRAQALNSAINRAVFANEAAVQFPAETANAVEIATREVAAQVFLSQLSKKIDASITKDQLKNFYEKNIDHQGGISLKCRYALFASAESAQAAYREAQIGKLANFEPLSKGDGFLNSNDIPYGLGSQIANLKKGGVLEPKLVREGFIVFVLDDIKRTNPPDFEQVEAQIKDKLSKEEIEKVLSGLRANSKITILE
jgi:uncharacterized protein (DUF2267 family)